MIANIEFTLSQVNNRTKYLDQNFQVVKDEKQRATCREVCLYILKTLSSQKITGDDLKALSSICSRVFTLYPEADSDPVAKVMKQTTICPLSKVRMADRVAELRVHLSALVFIKEYLKVAFHDFMLLTQSVSLDRERDILRRTNKNEPLLSDMMTVSVNVTDPDLFPFLLKYQTIAVIKDEREVAKKLRELETHLDHPNPNIQRMAKLYMVHYRASKANEARNTFEISWDTWIKVNTSKTNKEKDSLRKYYFPLISEYEDCLNQINAQGKALKKEGKGDAWTEDDLKELESIWDKIRVAIGTLDPTYERLHHEFQFALTQAFDYPEMREGWSKNIFITFDQVEEGLKSRGSRSKSEEFIQDEEARKKGDRAYEYRPFPLPEKFAQNFFDYAIYRQVTKENIFDYQSLSLPISEKRVEIIEKAAEFKEEKKKEEPVVKKVVPRRRGSLLLEQLPTLFNEHLTHFPAALQYDERIDAWFDSPLVDTFQNKMASLKHRIPKFLDFLLGTSYSRVGMIEKDGNVQRCWYLVMSMNAFGKQMVGVLAYTFDQKGILYHRYFEKEAQGDQFLSKSYSEIVEKTQNPTPSDIRKMDGAKKEKESSSSEDPKFRPPKGIKIEMEPYFGTISCEYEDHGIRHNGEPVQVKLEIYKP